METRELIIPRSSGEIKNLIAAFIAARREIPIIPKNKAVKFSNVNYNFSDLPSTVNYIVTSMANHGISVDQGQAFHGENIFIVTTLTHDKSGEWKEFYWFVPKPSPQELEGSTPEKRKSYTKLFNGNCTTARRYALQAAVCTATEEEDNDNTFGDPEDTLYVTEKQVALIINALSFKDPSVRNSLEARYGSLEKIPRNKCNDVLHWINPERFNKE